MSAGGSRLASLNGGGLGLNAESPIGREPSGRLVAQLEALQDFNVAWHRRCALRDAASCRGHRFQLQLQRDNREGTSNGIRGSVPIFRLDDVGLRRTLGGRLKTDPQITP